MTTERWALVPVEPDFSMTAAGAKSLQCDVRFPRPQHATATRGARNAYIHMIEASPGAALLAEVLAARDDAKESAAADKRNGGYGVPDQQSWLRVMRALDKLGPAAEGAT